MRKVFQPLSAGAFAGNPPWRAFLKPFLTHRQPNVDARPRPSTAVVRAHWHELHPNDGLACPDSEAELSGWVHYHLGDLEEAASLAAACGERGASLAAQVATIRSLEYAPPARQRQQLLKLAVSAARMRLSQHPEDGHALYWLTYALYEQTRSQSVTWVLVDGGHEQIKGLLARLIELTPFNPRVHLLLASFHFEFVNKVGALVSRKVFGLSAKRSLEAYEAALSIGAPASGLIAYADALIALLGEQGVDQAVSLLRTAINSDPIDYQEWQDIRDARARLKSLKVEWGKELRRNFSQQSLLRSNEMPSESYEEDQKPSFSNFYNAHSSS